MNNLQESLSIIKQVLAQYKGTLQEHQAIQNALNVVLAELEKVKKDEQKA